MPAKKKTTTKKTTRKTKSANKGTKLADVKLSIEHIVPTTQFGHVKYTAVCSLEDAEKVGLELTNVIGTLYPPYNPDIPMEEKDAEKFNRQAAKIHQENKQQQQNNLEVDDFEPAF